MGGSKSGQKQIQSQTTVTQQTDARVGASDDAIVAQDGSTVYGHGASSLTSTVGGNVTIQSIDSETIAGALGLSETVARELAALAGGIVQESSQLSEKSTARVATAMERFAADLTDIQATAITGGATESNKLITQIIFAGAALVALVLLLPLIKRSK